ncbi:TPA: hypothetical protein ACH3X1_005304 [Trebouxia sp. C0004]
MLLWCAKAACSIVLAVLQASVTYEHIQLSFQDVLPACSAVIQCLFVAAVLYEHRTAQQELRTWQSAQQAWLLQQDDQGEPVLHISKNWASWLVFYWVHPLMARGSKRQLQASDLFQLPKALLPSTCSNRLWGIWAEEQQAKTLLTAERGHIVQPLLLKALFKAYGLPYLFLGIIKLVNDILNFAGPLLLNVLIRYLETPPAPFDFDPQKAAKGNYWRSWLPQPDSLAFGLGCAGLLGITNLIKAVLNSHYSYQQGQISCQLRSAITCLVFKKALLINSVDMTLFASGAVQTLMSVDADRVVNLCVSLHELWSLPAQIAIALYLLYTQVRYAFLAGLAVVVLLIPVNRWLATKIEAASERMMAHKDARLQLMGELLRGIHQVKLSAWEPRFITKVNEARKGEMQALAVRKYLDALCVYFWAATSLLFSLFTFGLFVLLGHKLTAEVVFTSLALFNVLISPLNSFPWVVNGLVEAVVSVRRLQGFLSSWDTKSDWAYQMDTPQDAIPRAESVSALAQHERNALAEGLTSEALQMSRADSSDLYTTINMERLPSGASPRLSTTPSFGAWSPMHRHQSSSAPTSTHPSPLQQRSGPPPAPGDNPNPNLISSPAARTFSTSFKGWGQALGATAHQGTSTTVSASNQESQTSNQESQTSNQESRTSNQGIVTVLSDSSRLAATTSGDGHSIVLSGASFAWQPTLGRSRVVSQVRRQDPSRQGHPGRQGVLQPLLSDAAQQDVGSSNLVLHEINLTVRSGDLLVVTGEIGAGKSSLLAALLGEMEQRCGHMRVQGTVAYVPQQPWIMTGTLRDNILFGKELLPDRYQAVVKACALEADIEQMTQGDATLIGDRGVTLSGGQRARLSLARAIYQDCDIYLLDDILAAVDAHVAAWLTTHALTGPMLDAKTRVVCSNASLITVVADQTVRLYKGKVLRSDMSAKLGGSDEAVRGGMSVRGTKGQPSPLSIALGLTDVSRPEPVEVSLPAETIEGATAQMPGAEEGRMVGHVRWQVYTAYMKAVGTGLVLFVLLSLALMQITRNGNDLWLSYWVSNLDSPHDHHHHQMQASPTLNSTSAHLHSLWHDPSGLICSQPWLQPNSLCYSSLPTHTQYTSLGSLMQSHTQMNPVFLSNANATSSLQTAPPAAVSQSVSLLFAGVAELSRNQPVLDPDTEFYLVVLLCIAAANSVFTFVRAFSFAYGGLVAARKLHEQLLTAVISAPAKFFQTTLPGRVLNRFSSDIATADDALPFTLNILLANIFGLVGTVLVLCLSEPYLLLALIPLVILYKYLQTYYRHTARELRRLNSIARSPVYATFTEALDGAASIRAYNAQHRFCQLNEQQVGLSQQAAFAGIAAAQWLGLRLQSIAAFVITLVAVLAVLGHQGLLPFAVSDGKFAASLVGLSLAYALPITDRLNGLLTVSAETEQEMVAVERLAEYTDLPPQPSTLHPHSQSDTMELPFQRQRMSLGSDMWPQGGYLQFCGVQLKYSQEAPHALAGVSFELRPGQKVGICGRTGAGKSSLVAALLRLTETKAGAILLDGKDCRTVPLQTLRRAIGVVPQTPFLFQGSIRENLDPLANHSDRHMMSLLKDVGLWDVLAGLSLSRSKAAGQPIPTAITSYASSVASSAPTGTPPRSPLVRPGVPSRLASKPPLHGSAPLGSLNLSTLSVTEEEERLLEEAGSSLTSPTQHPDPASLISSAHTRVLRVAPVSSHFGPPSFPASSASLDLPDDHVVPVSRQPFTTAPGGLSRSLSASASSGGQMPSGISTHDVSQTGSAPHSTMTSATLVTSSSLPPIAPLMATKVPVQSVARHKSANRPSEGVNSSGRTPEQQSASPSRSALQGPTDTEQGAHDESAVVLEARQDPSSHSASLESGYPVPRKVVPVGATHQGSPLGQGSSRHSPSVQNSRRPQDRKPVIESCSSTEFHIQRQWPNFGVQLLSLQLGEGGMGLSQGQQQLLCLARVLLEHPRVVCLDEAMANVDPETARLMQHILTTHLPESTILQIAHRLDAILECDWAVVMDKGKVVEQGSPQELLKRQSHFAAMYLIGS